MIVRSHPDYKKSEQDNKIGVSRVHVVTQHKVRSTLNNNYLNKCLSNVSYRPLLKVSL